MKKILIPAAILFTTGIFSLNIKVSKVKHTVALVPSTFFDCKKELASGD